MNAIFKNVNEIFRKASDIFPQPSQTVIVFLLALLALLAPHMGRLPANDDEPPHVCHSLALCAILNNS